MNADLNDKSKEVNIEKAPSNGAESETPEHKEAAVEEKTQSPSHDGGHAQDGTLEAASIPQPDEVANYTAFTTPQKVLIAALASLSSFFSPFTGSVYLPALNTLASHYHTSVSRINLTITTYMILQAIAPMFTGGFGDSVGRRPAVILCLVIYLAANVALALQNSYTALLVLRMLQSAGSSGTVALSRGIIADVIAPAERGLYMGVAMTMISFAPAIAPIIGGALTQAAGWRWIFWFLVILTASFLVPFMAFMPETNRRIVGDGSVRPSKWYHVSLMDVLRRRRDARASPEAEVVRQAQQEAPKGREAFSLRGPWRTITLLLEKDIALISIYGMFLYGALYAYLTSTPVLFASRYGLDDLQVGLCYLPIGAGLALAGIVNGRVLDWNWRRVALARGLPYDRRKAHDLRAFPVEVARLQVVFPTLLPGLCAMLPYGWAIQHGAPLAVPLVLQFIVGWSLSACGNVTQNLSIDLFPGEAATVAANNNLTRCLFGAGTAAVINPMLKAMGAGWTYTLITGLVATSYPILWWEMKCGPRWREERRLRVERKARQREQVS